jgi:hypothetical protein
MDRDAGSKRARTPVRLNVNPGHCRCIERTRHLHRAGIRRFVADASAACSNVYSIKDNDRAFQRRASMSIRKRDPELQLLHTSPWYHARPLLGICLGDRLSDIELRFCLRRLQQARGRGEAGKSPSGHASASFCRPSSLTQASASKFPLSIGTSFFVVLAGALGTKPFSSSLGQLRRPFLAMRA